MAGQVASNNTEGHNAFFISGATFRQNLEALLKVIRYEGGKHCKLVRDKIRNKSLLNKLRRKQFELFSR
jgi:hypothetical protein